MVVLPAVDEPGIGSALESLRDQGVEYSRVIVAVNNAKSNITAESVASLGWDKAEVLDLGQITGRKAGALNRALEAVGVVEDGLYLVMDADTVLCDNWVSFALASLSDENVGAVGAVFQAESGSGWLWGCQKREWFRYSEEIDRTGKTSVLSGTAAIIRGSAFNSVKERYGFYYDESAITEDFRLTVHLKECDFILMSPVECRVETETMPTIKMLFKQRRRWSLGALQTVKSCGFTKVTWLYWYQQFMLALACLCLVGVVVISLVMGFGWQWWSFILLGIMMLERTVTAWPGGWKDRIIALLLVPEFVYMVILQVAHVAAWVQFIRRSNGEWSHV